MALNDHTPSQAFTPNYSLVKVGTRQLQVPWSAIVVMRWEFKKAPVNKWCLEQKKKRQVGVGKVTAGLNGQQTAHPGSGHLHHSANANEGPLSLEQEGIP